MTNQIIKASQEVMSVIAWRKSTRSPSAGGNCVEAGAWRKSARSSSGGNVNCVEAGTCPHQGIAVRDSKHPAGTPLSMNHTDWTALLATVTSTP